MTHKYYFPRYLCFIAAVLICIFPESRITAQQSFGFTYQRADGNRLVEGRGEVPRNTPIDVLLDGRPVWLVAAPDGDTVIWAAVLEDGGVRAFQSTGKTVKRLPIRQKRIPPGTPPLLIVTGSVPRLLASNFRTESTATHPVFLPRSRKSLSILQNGSIVLRNGQRSSARIDALPDARPVFDEKERVLILTGRTTSYRHGALGDTVEAQSVTLIETEKKLKPSRIITVPQGSVIEGIAPIWTDMNGDGIREIVLTVSDRQRGTRFVLYDESGIEIASSPALGKGFRWRHQIAVAHFGPGGELELAGVRTPHIGGVVEFFRLEDGRLVKTASATGFSSHVIGSRNLDMAAAGDFDSDGSIELLVPVQSLQELAALRHTEKGAETVWTLPLPGRLSTNLAAATLDNGRIALGIGSEDGTLRFWLPDRGTGNLNAMKNP